MPIYEYRCNHCEHRLEKLQKISDEPAKTCPECGEDRLQKLVSAAAFKLKGTGWYETDFKDAKTSNDNQSDSKKTSGSDTKKTDDSSKSTAKKESPKPSANSA